MPLKLLIFLFLQVTFGCHQNTFSNTSVTVAGVKGVNTINGCFELSADLINVTFFQVVNETVPVLREGAISNLPKLLEIYLESDGIEEMKPGALQNLSSLRIVRVKRNKIKNINAGVFSGLLLKELDLSSNQIEHIHEDAFNDMPNLSTVFLNNNKLTQVTTNLFKRSPAVYLLHFENNFIEKIPSRAFTNLKGEHFKKEIGLHMFTNLLFENNKIRLIEDNAFDGFEKLGFVFLNNNEIDEFKESTLGSLKHITWLRLDHNKLKCIPRKLVEVSPKVLGYLKNNPLTDECNSFLSNVKQELAKIQ